MPKNPNLLNPIPSDFQVFLEKAQRQGQFRPRLTESHTEQDKLWVLFQTIGQAIISGYAPLVKEKNPEKYTSLVAFGHRIGSLASQLQHPNQTSEALVKALSKEEAKFRPDFPELSDEMDDILEVVEQSLKANF